MESLEKRIAARVKRKKDAGNEVDADVFAARSDGSERASAGTTGELSGAGKGKK